MGIYDRREVVGGRIVVAILFVVFCALGFYVHNSVPPEIQPGILPPIVIAGPWIVALLWAIWCGLNWARYILIGVLGLCVLVAVTVFLDFRDQGIPLPQQVVVVGGAFVAMMMALAFLPWVRELTGRPV